jgi:hypothetical protein
MRNRTWNSNANASRKFSVSRSTITGFIKDIFGSRKFSESIQELPSNKDDRALLLAKLDDIVMQYKTAPRRSGGMLNRNIVGFIKYLAVSQSVLKLFKSFLPTKAADPCFLQNGTVLSCST